MVQQTVEKFGKHVDATVDQEIASYFPAPAQGSNEVGCLDDFRVLEVISQGGMRIAFRAVHFFFLQIILPVENLYHKNCSKRNYGVAAKVDRPIEQRNSGKLSLRLVWKISVLGDPWGLSRSRLRHLSRLSYRVRRRRFDNRQLRIFARL